MSPDRGHRDAVRVSVTQHPFQQHVARPAASASDPTLPGALHLAQATLVADLLA